MTMTNVSIWILVIVDVERLCRDHRQASWLAIPLKRTTVTTSWARLFLRLSEESSTTSHKNSSKAVHKLKFWSHSHLLIVTSLSVSQYVSDSERG